MNSKNLFLMIKIIAIHQQQRGIYSLHHSSHAKARAIAMRHLKQGIIPMVAYRKLRIAIAQTSPPQCMNRHHNSSLSN